MKFWKRAGMATNCGNCGDTIAADEPMLILQFESRQLKRCSLCAGESVNWDQILLAPKVEPKEPSSFRPVYELAERFDARMAAAGKDPE